VPAAPSAPKLAVERRAMVPGLDRRSAARLSKGALAIEARLDLHGLRQADAYAALRGFILEAVRRERRCVLVVTGKGRTERGPPPMGEEAPGVLKRNLPRWLEEPPLAGKVLALRQAMPQHGGEGAWYVLLRRRRR
jgi:DNA-nicking Smr family endonuclease